MDKLSDNDHWSSKLEVKKEQNRTEQNRTDWWRKPEYTKKTTNLSQVADKLDHWRNVVSYLHIAIHERGANSQHWLHMDLQIQLPYDHDHDGPSSWGDSA
jgi:hypothetical protein